MYWYILVRVVSHHLFWYFFVHIPRPLSNLMFGSRAKKRREKWEEKKEEASKSIFICIFLNTASFRQVPNCFSGRPLIPIVKQPIILCISWHLLHYFLPIFILLSWLSARRKWKKKMRKKPTLFSELLYSLSDIQYIYLLSLSLSLSIVIFFFRK